MPTTPFKPAETKYGAFFEDVGGWRMPRLYLPVSEEIERGRSLGGIVDRSDWTKLRLLGKDAVEFTNNYTTNNLKTLQPGKGLSAAVTTWKGTMVDHVIVQRDGSGLRLIGHPGSAQALRRVLEQFMINVEVLIEDDTEQEGLLYVFGPFARALMARVTGLEPYWSLHAPVNVRIAGHDVVVSKTWPAFGDGYHVLVDKSHAAEVFEAIAQEGDAKGVVPIGYEAWETLRIEQGIPAYPSEISESVNPWEARLADSVSMSKGCYLGQEVVGRLANYDKVQRYLVGLRFAPSEHPEPGSEIRQGEQKVGTVTSATAGSALGFVKGAFLEPGTAVTVRWGDRDLPAVLERRPFWQEMAGEGIGARHSS